VVNTRRYRRADLPKLKPILEASKTLVWPRCPATSWANSTVKFLSVQGLCRISVVLFFLGSSYGASGSIQMMVPPC
jgi:hypothetical protein